ncbi:hypothetical protein GCM10028806_37010 [Spirosoma terrae]|uniref:Glycosyltransferase family 4 protein n=1 Tax=Spirosoma terrae TaxID=1968276 RepID=A0A6L9LPN9_9BACT|nr:glycosyltransferase [Spirosoma terrae]NDU98919.1 glycosyltransferase family 4 protein [Spirosoma terrae]
MNQLVCDLDVQVRGHNLGYIQTIVNLLNQRNMVTDRTLIFLFNSPVRQQLALASVHANISLVFITEEENTALEQCNGVFSRREAEWKLIKQYARHYNIDDVLILELDQYHISIGNQSTPFSISGIYFRPHFRIEAIGGGTRNFIKYWLLRQKKRWLEMYMCRNKSLRHIYILNDQQTVDAMNHLLKPVFRYLPDPILTYEPTYTDIRKSYSIEDNRCTFLIFGSIDERKNIENLFAAFAKLTPDLAQKAALLVVGPVKRHYKSILSNALQHLRLHQPGLQIVHRDEFISDSEMETLFSECNFPLLVYRDFFGSSGLLGQAAKHNKPVLVSTYGLMPELVERYKLGNAVSPKDIDGIARYLTKSIQNYNDVAIDGQAFYQDHSPDKFLSTLLQLKDETNTIHI